VNVNAYRSPGRRPGTASLGRAAKSTAVVTLIGIGALHAAWGSGSSWPMADRADLADAVLGAPGSQFGGASASYAVAGALGTAAALVAGWPQTLERPRRVAVAGIAAILAGRGAVGLAGHTNWVSPVSTGSRFRRLDRQVYAPLCLTLAALTALSLTGEREPAHDERSPDANP
jgi:hypothetical protein